MISSKAIRPGLLSRKAAWEVLQAVAAGAYADVALDRILRRNSFTDVDRGLVTELAYGAIRQRHYLDAWVDYCGKLPVVKQPPLLRWLLHLGLYQILLMDRIPVAAAVDITVELANRSKLARLAPVVNGILRFALRLQEEGSSIPVPESPIEGLAQKESLPVWLAAELIHWKGHKDAEMIAKAFNKTPSLDLRVNRLRINAQNLQKSLACSGIETSFINGCPDGLQVLLSSGDLRQWPGYREGHWSVQDRSAQWVTPLLDPNPGDRVLDACSAPGGKTMHLAELMKDAGEIWAVDRSSQRLKLVKDNAKRLGFKSINFLVADSSKLFEEKPDWVQSFDCVLIDAPCSGLGTLARHPDARWRMSPDQIDSLVLFQFKLLEGILPLLKPGGKIVYSTCTIHPRENFSQIRNFLKKYSKLHLEEEQQIWPNYHQHGDGFYAAKINLSP